MTQTKTTFEGYFLSPQQAHIWNLQKKCGDRLRCNFVLRLQGDFDAKNLAQIWAKIIRRQESLRSDFQISPEFSAPLQVINSSEDYGWSEIKFSSEADSVETVLAELQKDSSVSHKTQIVLTRTQDDEFLLGISVSSLLGDVETANVLAKEISDETAQNEIAEVISAVQFAALQNEFLDDPENASARLFWLNEIERINSDAPILAVKNTDLKISSFAVRNFDLTLLKENVKAVSEKFGVEAKDVFLTAWAILAARFTSEDSAAIFAETDGRIYGELENLVVRAAKNLPLNFKIDSKTKIADLLENIGATREQSENYQESFDAADLPKNAFPFGFAFHRLKKFSAANYSAEVLTASENFYETNLHLRILETDKKFTAEFAFNRDFLAESLADEMLRSFVFVLEQICENPQIAVSEIGLLSLLDAENLLKKENQTRRDFPFKPLFQMFDESVIANQNQTAIVSDEILTFAEFSRKVNKLANFLHRKGAKSETVIPILLPHGAEALAAMLAVSKIGAAYLPLEISMPKDRLEYILADSKAEILLTETKLSANLTAKNLKILAINDYAEEIGSMPENVGEINIEPLQTAYVIYTSGSTGKPKGVAVMHEGLSNYLNWARDFYRGNSDSGAPLHSSVAFDMAVTSCFVPLLNGKSVCLTSEITAENPASLLEVWRDEKSFDFVKLTPAHAKLLGANLEKSEAGKAEKLILGGETLNASDLEFFRENAPQTRIINEYGPTETVVGCTIFVEQAGKLQNGNIPIGKPIANVQIYLLDAAMNQVPHGVTGEIFIGGKGLANGYLHKSAITAERFVPNPFSNNGTRLYCTGDLALRREDDNLIYLGRNDSQVKIRGFRVEPSEIETALLEIENVAQSAVVVKNRAENQPILGAFVVLKNDSKPISAEELRGRLSEKLPEPMIPAKLFILEFLPLNQNGKIDRRKLADISENEFENKFAAPRTTEEQILAGIWAQILKLPQVGIDDKYFALGGDSIRSIQIIAGARKQGIKFSIEQLFRLQTIRRIAQELHHHQSTPPLKIEPFGLISAADLKRIPKNIESSYPLSRLQSGMVFHRELAPDSAIYHDVFGYHLKSPFDAERLREAIKQLVARHPAMRTSFDLQNFSEPLQLVHAAAETPFEIEDISHLSVEKQENFLQSFLESEKNNHFDYAKPPLLRFFVHIRSAETFQFWISFHHAIIDGWSDISLLVELGLSYGQLLRGEEISFQTPETHYRDFIALEREALTSEIQREFWQKTLDGSEFLRVPRLDLNDKKDTPDSGVHIARVPLSDEVSNNLFHLSQKLAMPLKSILMAAHLKVLQSVSGNDDVLTGLVSVGRPETTDAEKVLGLHLNSVPFRAKLGSGAWRDLIQKAFEIERETIPHRRFPLAEIQNMRDGNRITETLFYFTHYYNVSDLEAVPELEIYGWYGFEQSSFPLITHFSVNSFNSSVEVSVIGDKREFGFSEIERLGEIYARALKSLNDSPNSVYTENLLSEDERKLLSGNLEKVEVETHTIKSVFEETAEKFAENIALVWEDGEFSYSELNAEANLMAHYLLYSGVKSGDCVGLFLNRSKEMIVGILAALKIGAAYMPIETDFPDSRISLMCRESAAKVILTTKKLFSKLALKPTEIIYFEDLNTSFKESFYQNPLTNVHFEDTAYLMFTSGSTGQPKGVAVPHRAVIRLVKNADYVELSDKETILQITPNSFDVSIFEIFGALLNGGKLVLMPAYINSTHEIGAAIEKHQATTIWLTAGLFNLMVDENLADLARLRQLLAGGDALSPEHTEKFLAENKNTKLINGYGPTENGTFTTCQTLNGKPILSGKVPIGKSINGTKSYILDKNLKLLPFGAVGELFTSGAGLAHGYVNQPKLTAEKFIPNPFSNSGERLYGTGDLAFCQPDGTIEFVGRADKQVKIRGFRVEPEEVESVLRANEEISNCVVQVRKNSVGEKYLAAYLVFENAPRTSADLREYLQSGLPDFMIPATFTTLETIPLKANGKVDYDCLPEPSKETEAENSNKTAPATKTEQILFDIWREILGEDKFGVNDDFFALGGHSLKAMQMINRIREAFAAEIPLRAVFELPNVQKLAAKIDSLSGSEFQYESKNIIFPPRTGEIPLTSAQERLWFLDQIGNGSTAYNVPLQIKVSGKIDLAILEKSFCEVISRHEILRTGYSSENGVPKTKIKETGAFKLETLVFENSNSADFEKISSEFISRPFDLTIPPLLRGKFIKLSETQGVLLIALHHIIGDAWSIGILMREIADNYSNLSKGIVQSKAHSPVQYADYANWQKKWLDGNEKDESLAFWKKQLFAIKPLDLPTDFPRPERQTFQGAKYSLEFSVELTEKLEKISAENNTTLFTALFAVFNVLLSEYAKQNDISIGTDVANRTFKETENIFGLFVNQIVLRTKLNGTESFNLLLKQVTEDTLKAFEHQELPFAKVVESIKPGRNLRQNPLFQVMFILQNTPLPKIEIEGLQFEAQEFDTGTTAFDLSLHVWQVDDFLRCTFRYGTDLFTSETIAGFAENFRDLCQKIVENANFTVSELAEIIRINEKKHYERSVSSSRNAGLERLKALRQEKKD